MERNPPLPFLSERGRIEKGGRIFFFGLLSYALTPTLSRWEREFALENSALKSIGVDELDLSPSAGGRVGS